MIGNDSNANDHMKSNSKQLGMNQSVLSSMPLLNGDD